MKLVKTARPVYAVNLGAGRFVGPTWQCMKCGKTNSGGSKPNPNISKCPATASGNHIWEQI
ncbi:MAG: hypothetical protein IIX47_07505 [Spirochaetaceae bacterium]|nr:hypothetical protein [Spirochaetaceae bacterium]